jgi:hypothetical protein
MTQTVVTVTDMFCGAGGSSQGAVAAGADQEIDAILMEPQPSLADCFMMFDRTCLGGRA